MDLHVNVLVFHQLLLGSLSIALGTVTRPYLTVADDADLKEIRILSPVPITGPWRGGQTLRLVGMLAEDILNSQQVLIPGYRLVTDWMDDTCNSVTAVRMSLSNLYITTYSFLGAHGCSGDCIAMAPVASAVRKPFGSYCCAAVSLSDPAKYPDMVRFAGSEGAYWSAFAALGKQYGWKNMSVVSGLPRRWDATASWMVTKLQAAGFEAERVGPVTHTPTFEDCVDVMSNMKLHALRVIVLMAYPQVMAMMVCAAKHVGMPKGIVWLTHAGNPPVDFSTHGKGLADYDSDCTPDALQELWEGEIAVGDNGKPSEADMDRELDCYPGYTPRSFHALLDQYLEAGYPIGENIPTDGLVKTFQGTAADGLCMWALTARHMFDLGFNLDELKKPNETTYQEMIRFIHDDMSFFGVLGRINFTGPDYQATLAVSQMQSGKRTKIATFDQAKDELAILDNQTFIWGGNETMPTNTFIDCEVGALMEASDSGEPMCASCVNTSYFELQVGACVPCRQGFYKNSPGGIGSTGNCIPCEPGFFAAAEGSSSCDECPAGTSTDGSRGHAACVVCRQGHFSSRSGSNECLYCELGFTAITEGATVCDPCPIEGSVTRFLGAAQLTDCVCPNGAHFSNTSCVPCPSVGVFCPGGTGVGHQIPDQTVMIEEGYMTLLEAPFSVYACAQGPVRCPGRRSPRALSSEQMCAPGFQGRACGRCRDGTYLHRSICRACQGTDDSISKALGIILAFLSVTTVAATIYHNEIFPPDPIKLALGQIFNFFVALAIISTIEIKWSVKILSIIESISFFNLNLGALGIPIACVIGSTSLASYTFKMVWPFSLLTGFLSIYVYSHCLKAVVSWLLKRNEIQDPLALLPAALLKRLKWFDSVVSGVSHVSLAERCAWWCPINWYNLKGAIITTHAELFILLTSCSMSIFFVRDHPNGERTVQSFPDVEYLGLEWWTAFPFALTGLLLYTIAFLAAITYVVYVAPLWCGNCQRFRDTYNCLWDSYHPRWWWFCTVDLLFGLGVNLVKALTSLANVQITLTVLILIFYIVIWIRVLPSRFNLTNWITIFFTLGMLTFTLSLVLAYDVGENEIFFVFQLATIALPLIVMFSMVVRYVLKRKMMIERHILDRRQFTQRLHDITSIVGAMSSEQLRRYALRVLDNDVRIISRALDTLQFTLLGLQPPNRWKWRCDPEVPFNVGGSARLEGELIVRGIYMPGDCRSLARRLRTHLAAQESKKDLQIPATSSGASTTWGMKAKERMLGLSPYEKNLCEALSGDDEYITMEEFVSRMPAVCNTDLSSDELHRLFKYLDADLSGSCTSIELFQGLKSLEEAVVPDFCSQWTDFQSRPDAAHATRRQRPGYKSLFPSEFTKEVSEASNKDAGASGQIPSRASNENAESSGQIPSQAILPGLDILPDVFDEQDRQGAWATPSSPRPACTSTSSTRGNLEDIPLAPAWL